MTLKILQAVTSLRVGDGTAVGAVDLPLARERHTRWPFVPGSSLRGALRGRATALGHGVDEVEAVFGSTPPEPGVVGDDLRMGTLRVGQATLLALPVRSLTRTFLLLTCPTALARLRRAAGFELEVPNPDVHQVCGANDRPNHLEEAGIVYVEDLDLEAVHDPTVAAWAQRLRAHGGDELAVERLVVVHDDVFAHACTAWTELRTRNRIEPSTGVVRKGQLFDVEFLPSETLMWVPLEGSGADLLPANGETFGLGGHQSVGAGRVVWSGGPS
ncbi:MAG: type III-B CRISPR module RAMP protein Cmr4 [Myxococcota bacterium]